MTSRINYPDEEHDIGMLASSDLARSEVVQKLSFHVVGYYHLKSQDRHYVCVIASTNGIEYIAVPKSGDAKKFVAEHFNTDVSPDSFSGWTARYSKAPGKKEEANQKRRKQNPLDGIGGMY